MNRFFPADKITTFCRKSGSHFTPVIFNCEKVAGYTSSRLLSMVMANTNNTRQVILNPGEPAPAPAPPNRQPSRNAVEVGRRRADEYIRNILDHPHQQPRPTPLDLLNKKKRLESERKKALEQRRHRRQQFLKYKRLLEREIYDVETAEASDYQ